MNSIGWLGTQLVDEVEGPRLVDGRGLIARWRVTELTTADSEPPPRAALPPPATTIWEVDEATQTLDADPIRVSLRHSIDQTWSIRILIHNTGPEPIRLHRLALAMEVGEDWTPWAACDGAEAMVAVLPYGPGQILGFAVLQGELRRDRTQLVIDDLLVAPGAQHVLRLRGDWHSSATELARKRPTAVPTRDWWEVGTVVEIDHPDQALLGSRSIPDDEDLAPYDAERSTELEPGRPGQVTVELAGPRGRAEVVVGFAPALADLVASFLEQAERRWPVGRQGMRIDSVADGVVLQHHDRFGDRGRIRYDDGQDALDGLIERMGDEGPFAAALLAEQALRTADPALAERASRALATVGPGAAREVVMLPVMAARVMTGLAPEPPRPQFSALPGPPTLVSSLAAAIAEPAQRDAAVRSVGAHWGLGLYGRRLAAPDLVADARLVALASVVSQFDPPQPPGWVLEWDELVAQQHCRLRGELWLRLESEPETVAAALAWLLLAP